MFCFFCFRNFVRKRAEMTEEKKKKTGLSESFIIGVVAAAFLMIGYQTALFIHNSAVTRIAAGRDVPDTVYVYGQGGWQGETAEPDASGAGKGAGTTVSRQIHGDAVRSERKNAEHSERVQAVRRNVPPKRVESFRFDPNTVSVEELCRLGFSPKQAQSIDNYRKKGGRFRRKSDFAKSYVVSDSIFRRLEPYIDIPLVDLNTADSAAFDALPGIGGWFASKMIAHRKRLGGYSYKEQLMDIRNFDHDKFAGLQELVTVSPEHVTPYPLWSLPADSLRHHPYIGNMETARAIVLFRENTPKQNLTVEFLSAAGILPEESAEKLSRCYIK